LREGPESEGEIFSAPLGDLESARLVVSAGVSRLTVRADDKMAKLYQARFEGPLPDVRVKDGVVAIRYPRRLWILEEQRVAEVTLSAAIPWHVKIQGGLSQVEARLGGLNLAELEIDGGLSMISLELPVPSGVVPLRNQRGGVDDHCATPGRHSRPRPPQRLGLPFCFRRSNLQRCGQQCAAAKPRL